MVESTRQSLAEAFQEVSFRANRLREWMELEPSLRLVESSFALFNDQVSALTPDKFSRMAPKLRDAWRRCHHTDVLELDAFTRGIECINKPLSPDEPNTLGPQQTLLTLVALAQKIQQALMDGNVLILKQHSADFQRHLSGQLADRRNMVNKEVRELCELTIRLKMRLES